MTPPLAGVTVLDLTRLLPGGYATLLMADLGADVIKVEEPGKGDYIRWTPPVVGNFSAAHIALNRNKRGVAINLKTEAGRAAFVRLARDADVVVESFRPGVMDRLGVGYEALREVNPGLIFCAITGYGQDGPLRDVAGHDVNYISYAGVASIVGPEERPAIPGVQVGDMAGGGMSAVMSILAALYRRAATGEGSFCDVSMMDGAASWLSIHAAEFVATGNEPGRERMHLSGAYPCYRIYPAADGWVSVGALEPQFWAALCEALDRPDLAGDAFAMGERRDEVIASLEEMFSTKTRAEWMELLAGRDVCVAPVKSFGEAFDDPQMRARDMIFEADVPGIGPWKHVGNPLKMSGVARGEMRLPPPELGEHTDEILTAHGFTATELEELRSQGAIA